MQIKKGQVYECLISYDNWTKGNAYTSLDDNFLNTNIKGRQDSLTYDGFIKKHFKLVETYSLKDISTDSSLNENTPTHYDNSKGSIYKFSDNQKLNSYEFDIIKRVIRCRKKGQFKEDLIKTKNLIDLYLKEFETDN